MCVLLEDGMCDLIVLVPDHCLSFHFSILKKKIIWHKKDYLPMLTGRSPLPQYSVVVL